jgi:hypothetical protein
MDFFLLLIHFLKSINTQQVVVFLLSLIETFSFSKFLIFCGITSGIIFLPVYLWILYVKWVYKSYPFVIHHPETNQPVVLPFLSSNVQVEKWNDLGHQLYKSREKKQYSIQYDNDHAIKYYDWIQKINRENIPTGLYIGESTLYLFAHSLPSFLQILKQYKISFLLETDWRKNPLLLIENGIYECIFIKHCNDIFQNYKKDLLKVYHPLSRSWFFYDYHVQWLEYLFHHKEISCSLTPHSFSSSSSSSSSSSPSSSV